jgi:plasmid stability protein
MSCDTFSDTDMPNLYVKNVPEDLYRALHLRARANRSSIAAEIIALLERNIPTAREIKRRKEFYRRMEKIRVSRTHRDGQFPTAEEMIREDRAR